MMLSLYRNSQHPNALNKQIFSLFRHILPKTTSSNKKAFSRISRLRTSVCKSDTFPRRRRLLETIVMALLTNRNRLFTSRRQFRPRIWSGPPTRPSSIEMIGTGAPDANKCIKCAFDRSLAVSRLNRRDSNDLVKKCLHNEMRIFSLRKERGTVRVSGGFGIF